MIFKPFHDNVLVRRDEVAEKVSPGGIVMPKAGQEAPTTCTVIAIGPDVPLEEMRAGSRVIVGTYSGTGIELEEKKYTVVRWVDVLGVLV